MSSRLAGLSFELTAVGLVTVAPDLAGLVLLSSLPDRPDIRPVATVLVWPSGERERESERERDVYMILLVNIFIHSAGGGGGGGGTKRGEGVN